MTARRIVSRAFQAAKKGYGKVADTLGSAIHSRTDASHLNALRGEAADRKRFQSIQRRESRSNDRKMGY